MLGSGSEAEDAVQETMVRAWRDADQLEAHAALKSWLYRIASNVCLDMLDGAQRRARPMDLGPASTADAALGAGLPEHAWVQPIADARVLPPEADPAEVAESRETLRLAFVAALQHLPPRQRAVLILREVLRWRATRGRRAARHAQSPRSTARCSARGRRSRRSTSTTSGAGAEAVDAEQQELLDPIRRRVRALRHHALVSLLHEDAASRCRPSRSG